MIFLILVLISCCCLVLAGGGGYYLYQSGEISRREVLNTLGMGTGDVSIVNISDDRVYAKILTADPDTGEWSSYLDLTLESFDTGALGSIPPGVYELQLQIPSNIPPGGSCWMEIQSGDQYQIVVVPAGIVITMEGYEPTNPDELDFQTSSLCRR
jgi:hypothetical protein